MSCMFTLKEAVLAVNGELVSKGADIDGSFELAGVSTDSRTVSSDELFVALKGEKFDGHDYCFECYGKGVRAFLVQDEAKIPEGGTGIVVKDTLTAYGLLARAYRMKLHCKVIGVTGSVGKTSTRRMIFEALSAVGKAHMTKKNLNNEIGLPSTILSAPSDTEYLVVEMGMRGRGEISYLTNIACPDIGVITNVGFSHIERLGSREEIRNAKMEITKGIKEGGILLVNGDDDFLAPFAVSNCPSDKKVAVISAERDPDIKVSCHASAIRDSGSGIKFDVAFKGSGEDVTLKDVTLKLTGIHNVRNALMGLMCVYLLGGDVSKAASSLADLEDLKGRGQIVDTGRYTVIDDAYNAAPESMEAAFEKLDRTGKGRRRIAVLGGMLELGDSSAELHERIGRSCGRYSFDKIFLMGEYSGDFVRGLLASDENACYEIYNDNASLTASLRQFLEEGDVVLFKASNGFGFYKMAEDLIKEGN